MAKTAVTTQSASDKRWEETAAAVRPDALEALNGLVKEDCDRSFLIACLRAIAWADLPRLSKAEVTQAVQDLRNAAELTRRLGGSDLGTWIKEAFPGAMSDLETDLDGLAQAVEKNISLADRRAARTRDDCLAAIEQHVVGAAKQYRDVEVSTLVSAAPEIEEIIWRETSDRRSATGVTRPAVAARGEYSEDALVQWRARHRQMLSKETMFEREWKAKLERAAKRRVLWETTWFSPLPTQRQIQDLLKQAVEAATDGLKET